MQSSELEKDRRPIPPPDMRKRLTLKCVDKWEGDAQARLQSLGSDKRLCQLEQAFEARRVTNGITSRVADTRTLGE